MPMIEDVLAGGVAEALARTAAQLREDCDALDALAAALLTEAADGKAAGGEAVGRKAAAGGDGVSVAVLGTAPAAVRRRALRSWLLASGVTELSDAQLRAVDALVDSWHGQGGVALPGHLVARRARGRLLLDRRAADGEG